MQEIFIPIKNYEEKINKMKTEYGLDDGYIDQYLDCFNIIPLKNTTPLFNTILVAWEDCKKNIKCILDRNYEYTNIIRDDEVFVDFNYKELMTFSFDKENNFLNYGVEYSGRLFEDSDTEYYVNILEVVNGNDEENKYIKGD